MRVYGAPMVRGARVGWVRVEIGPSGPVCSVVGTCRRRVVTRTVSLATATALMARGVPSVVRHRSPSRPLAAAS